jgi:uncharacterized protein HemX
MDNEAATPEKIDQEQPTQPIQPVQQADKPKKTVSLAVFIISLVLVLALGALAGYVIGGKVKEDELTKKYDAQISELNESANKAKSAVSDNTAENQQTIDELKAENASQKATIEQQNQKISTLEAEIETLQPADTNSDSTAQ